MLKKTVVPVLAVLVVAVFSSAVFAKELVVGVSWSNFQEERWKTDEAAMMAELKSHGAKYIMADAQASAEKTDPDTFKSDFHRFV